MNDDKIWSLFEERKSILQKSSLYKQILQSLDPLNDIITRIRCLGLGSIINSSMPMFQMALLSLLVDHLMKIYNDKKNTNNNIIIEVSVWDPIFDETEILFLKHKLHYKVIENDVNDKQQQKNTLFYLPHFPISSLEKFISITQPQYLLSNDLTVYNNKFTDSKFFSLYPNSARLANLISQVTLNLNKTSDINSVDEFQIVSKKNRKKKNPIKYIPSIIDYDFDSAFFKSVKSTKISNGNDLSNDWDSAFTDLAFYSILK
ncbi:hypothetical protein C6P40_003306 [Pichia californica]|uniref:SRR1-like domain-containing protein n=1 Tax=Pichia californica TaxID=460514 RepID=A0A9P6WNB2_9ASCO|nr:hypothetical protein C6P40_003306 [[Candida] californica]